MSSSSHSSSRKNHAVRDDYVIPKKRKMDSTNSVNVTKHYNALQSQSRTERKTSKIFYMRNFNNFIKSTLIKKYTDKIKERGRELVVLDLAAGKGGDLLKWTKAQVNKLVCTDIAKVSVETAQERYNKNNRRHLFSAEFTVCDASKEELRATFSNPDMKFDLTSCQFAIHYSFESEQQADRMIRNACQSLKEGGYFIGSTVDSQKLRERLEMSSLMSFGNSLYKVEFDSKEKFADFGCRYVFKLQDVVDCPEFVLDRDVFVRICRRYGMRLLEWTSFEQVFWQHADSSDRHLNRESFQLVKKMQALEEFDLDMHPAELNSSVKGDYNHARDYCEKRKLKYEGCHPRVLTLSESEWAVSSLYVAFAFVKDTKPSRPDFEPKISRSTRENIPLLIM